MEKFFDPFIKLLENPLTELFKSAGFGDGLAKAFSAALMTLILWQVGEWLKARQQKHRNNRAAKDLKPEFDYLTIKRYCEIFIPSRYARINPNRYQNPDEAYKHNDPAKLIPFMIKKSFNEKVENEKFYLILADSGMGKTAFMVNLYMTYHGVFNLRQNQKMRLFRFQPPIPDKPTDVLDRLKEIKNDEAKNTILLLDGLDEDPYILSKDPHKSDELVFEERLNAIANETLRFCDVVITCRTQYFPQQENQDYDLQIRKPGGGWYKLNKYYLFPFSDPEVRAYINRKYGRLKFWNRTKKEKARELVENSHKLMSRPMLLSYLDDLVMEDRAYRFSYEIYETLIEKWLIRESEKGDRNNRAEQEKFRANLRQLARQTALRIYQNWQTNGILHLTKDEALQIAKTHHIALKADEVKGKSLLTCDPLLNWKFAHKSILEYFLAKECADDWGLAFRFNFAGMDMARHFYGEIGQNNALIFTALDFVKIKGGAFEMGDTFGEGSEAEKPVHRVTVSDFYLAKYAVSQRQWQEIMGSNPSHFKGDDLPVENVSWDDAQMFIAKLNAKTGLNFRLPSEVEWEYAAREGGRKVRFGNGQDIARAGEMSFDARKEHKKAYSEVGEYRGKTVPVNSFKPNALGLYNMSGNVWEWCADHWHGDYKGAPVDGCAWTDSVENTQKRRVLRGGSFGRGPISARAANRNYYAPGNLDFSIGFRVVRGF